MSLSPNYIAELGKNVNQPNVVIELSLDGGVTKKYGYHTGGMTDVIPALKSVSSLQNKLDTKEGFATRGQITFTITGRDNFKTLVSTYYLKNRAATRKDGFVASGFAYSDYAATFAGKITDWTRKGDDLTITVSDFLVDTTKKIPEENENKTQYLDYLDDNPVDVMKNILITQLGIASGNVDSTTFDAERDRWLNGWKVNRIITEPKTATEYLNELQQETNSFIHHDGEKVSLKCFAPPTPGATVDSWTDAKHIIKDSLSCKSGYKDNFYNRVVVYYDYDDSGDDSEKNFGSAYIKADTASQSAAQWNEVKTKVIKSKWLRSRKFTRATTNITGVVLYHVNDANPAGKGYLKYTAATSSLQWRASDGSDYGESVVVTTTGKTEIKGVDPLKYVRVIITATALPGVDASDEVDITEVNGGVFAGALASQVLRRFKDPVATVNFRVGLNLADESGSFRKIAALVDITTDEAFEKGDTTWASERMMLTALRPDFEKAVIDVEAIETKIYTNNYGFISPASHTSAWDSATAVQKLYAFVGDTNNQLGAANDEGFTIW